MPDEPIPGEPTSDQPMAGRSVSDQPEDRRTLPEQPPPEQAPPDSPNSRPRAQDSRTHDPSGIELAIEIANSIAGASPKPRSRGGGRRKARSVADDEPRFSGSHPDSRDPQLVGNVLDGLITDRGWRTEIGLRSILTRWPELVGAVNAEHCTPEAFSDGVLHVKAESTTWATVMRGMAPQLVAKLNAELGPGAVKRIDVQGPAAPSWKHGIRSVRDGRGPRDTYG